MARDREHLQLPNWQQPLPRRKRPGGGSFDREDKQAHGQTLLQQAEEISSHLSERKRIAPKGIDPKLVFKLQLNASGNLDEDQLRQMGLGFLARDAKRAIVVFPDEETLTALRQHIREYSGLQPNGHKYSYLAAVEAVTELGPDDRVGFRLRANPIASTEIASLDIELWHPGNQEECRKKINEIRAFLSERQLSITDSWIGEYICLIRAKVDSATLDQLLKIDYIREIDRRPQPGFEMLEIVKPDLSQIQIEENVSDNLTGILIIDSGVATRHPLLAATIGDAQVFPDRLRQHITGGPEDGDEKDGGHGTSVAGIAAYNDIGECLQTRQFTASARIFSARVTDDNNEYDDEELVEHQLEESVEYFLSNYPLVKVINISLGDSALYYRDGEYQFRFAAVIDELAYRYRDKDILFVVSAGNYWPAHLKDEEIRVDYPHYLIGDPEAHVIDPATSAIAITVGGLSYGIGKDIQPYQDKDTDHPIAGQKGFPSPFTRSGWGVDGAIKPDLVDYAGDWHFEHGRITPQPYTVGIPTTNKNFGPPEGRLFRTVAGTSFAAPRVANIAAQLFREFPNASSNLIRALLADSARVPLERPELFTAKEDWDEDILRIYGYGQANFERARWSSINEVLLISDSTIRVDDFMIYTIPPLPREFLTTAGSGFISVTLAFDPPTRHTRGDSYLGITMDFSAYRNVSPEAVTNAFRAWNREEQNDLENHVLPSLQNLRQEGGPPVELEMKPGTNRRKKGTLQHATLRIRRADWRYDGSPLILALTCQRKWAPGEITDQRYAVVVSISHDEPLLDLYTQISQQTRLYQKARIQV